MHDAERDLPGLTKLKHEGWDNLYYRQIYREQKVCDMLVRKYKKKLNLLLNKLKRRNDTLF